MRLKISHTTHYTYEAEASYAIQSLRYTPPDFDGQSVHEWEISEPGAELSPTGIDGFGNQTHLAVYRKPHTKIAITAQGEIETKDTNGIITGLNDPAPTRVYLRHTAKTVPDEAILDLARNLESQANQLERLHTLMHAIRKRITYTTGVTHVHTTAAAALADGIGVCQDYAHVFIACARALKIPARYVTGYLLLDENTHAEAHHAWAEAWVEHVGWVGFDVANAICPTDQYVRLTWGLDSHFAAPIHGSRRGGHNEALNVAVKVQQQ